ncbi:MAG: OsmC family protein, partial [Flavobacteriales bacterium]|nr:OsmC family protein [Flavobacteriales bacterium]
WPHGSIRVTAELDRTSANGKVESRFTLKVGLPEELDDDQRARMLQIATHCPVHRTLENPIHLKAELT